MKVFVSARLDECHGHRVRPARVSGSAALRISPYVFRDVAGGANYQLLYVCSEGVFNKIDGACVHISKASFSASVHLFCDGSSRG